MTHILILGASSDIGYELAKQSLEKGHTCTLSIKDETAKSTLQQKLPKTDAISYVEIDFEKDSPKESLQKLKKLPDTVICLIGYLGDQKKALSNLSERQKIINLNYLSLVQFLSEIAEKFKERKSGTIVGISSVAGDRGRKSNFYYGSAKAGFTAFLSGLRAELYPYNVHVITIRPGFMKTKMTAHLKLPKLITLTPDQAAKQILTAIKNKKNDIYIGKCWAYIMFIVKRIPENIFKKLNI